MLGAAGERPGGTPAPQRRPFEIEATEPARARTLALRALERIEQDDAYADAALDATLRRSRLADDRDRALATELVYGVTRWRRYLDYLLGSVYSADYALMDPALKRVLRVALYQMLYLDRIPTSAAVDEAVKAAKKISGQGAGGLVNGMLRTLDRMQADLPGGLPYPETDDPVHDLGVRYSHPDWVVRRWLDRFGRTETEALLRADNERPGITLRVNRLRTTPDELVARLQAADVAVERSPLLPQTLLRVGALTAPVREAMEAGLCSVQDESAALACALVDPQPGETVIDLCAAPGGKSTGMAEAMGNTGTVAAVDLHPAKLPRLTEGAERLGLSIILPIKGDGREIELNPADRVLIDAPCSGLGVLARRTDLRWRRTPEDLADLTTLQRQLLDHGATLVKPGGVLVYSTCSIEPEENGEIVAAFLATHPEFRLEPADTVLPAAVVNEAGHLATLPHRHGTDGAFAARLRRQPEPPNTD